MRNVRFTYQEDEILSKSLTSTNFHTHYQGSEMVVAGKLPDAIFKTEDLIEYEILATKSKGETYKVEGAYNGSAVRTIGKIQSKN